jgi:hypothetical protein
MGCQTPLARERRQGPFTKNRKAVNSRSHHSSARPIAQGHSIPESPDSSEIDAYARYFLPFLNPPSLPRAGRFRRMN